MDVDPPRALRFRFSSDGIGPTEIAVSLAPASSHASVMVIEARFTSDADLERGLDIGFVDGVARACASAHALL